MNEELKDLDTTKLAQNLQTQGIGSLSGNKFTNASGSSFDLSKPIPVSALGQTGTLPQEKPDNTNYAGIMSGIQGGLTTQQTAAEAKRQADTDMMNNAVKQYFGSDNQQSSADLYSQMRGETGISEKEQRVNDLTAQLNQVVAEGQTAQMQLESGSSGKDVTSAFLGRQQQEIQRQAAIRALPIQAQLSAAQGNLQTAQSNLETLFKLKSEDAERRYNRESEIRKFVYQFATDKEKRELEALEKESERNFQKEMLDYRQELDKEMLRFKTGLEGVSTKAPTIQKINGVDMQWNPSTGKFETIAGSQVAQPQALAQSQSNITQVDELLKSGGLSSAVGTNFLSRSPQGFWGSLGAVASVIGIPSFISGVFKKATGQTQNFIAGVEQLQSQLSLDSLIQAKAKGATFGALSDSEMKILSASASKLGSWVQKDSSGNVVGYNTTEANLKKELDKINNFAKIDYLLKGGNPDDIGAKTMPDGTVWTQNSDGTYSQLK